MLKGSFFYSYMLDSQHNRNPKMLVKISEQMEKLTAYCIENEKFQGDQFFKKTNLTKRTVYHSVGGINKLAELTIQALVGRKKLALLSDLRTSYGNILLKTLSSRKKTELINKFDKNFIHGNKTFDFQTADTIMRLVGCPTSIENTLSIKIKERESETGFGTYNCDYVDYNGKVIPEPPHLSNLTLSPDFIFKISKEDKILIQYLIEISNV